MTLDCEDDNAAFYYLFKSSDVLCCKGFLGKCQQVAGKQHLRMLINYGLTDVTKCLQSLGFEKTMESLVQSCYPR